MMTSEVVMKLAKVRFSQFLLLISLAIPMFPVLKAAGPEQHLLYVANPGTRNYVEYGGVGILVFDIDNGYKFVRRIPTWDVADGKAPENVRGIAVARRESGHGRRGRNC